MKSIIGRKMGMTEVFAQDGTMYPVTVVEVLPNAVTAKKTKEKDGYEAIQVGYEDMPERKANKAIAKNGRTTYAKVVDIHDTAGVMVNGMMPHGVVVRYFDAHGRINNDMIKIEPESSHYGTISVGETLEIKELDGRCVLVRELENLPFEGSEMLIDPTVSVYGEGETMSVNCPVCGAVVNVARGGAAFCSHCGYKVRLGNDGKVMNNG